MKRWALGDASLSSTGEQAFRPCRLHRGAAVRATQAVAIAVLPDCLVDGRFPATQVFRLTPFERKTFFGVGTTCFPPLQPGGAEGMHEKVEQSGEAHANDGIPGPALAIPLDFKLVIEEARH